MFTDSTAERVIVIGGGFAGVAAAAQLAQSGLPVTLFEASQLGYAASTRNQGWLQSGASFAKSSPELARRCYESMSRTVAFCPECLEAHANPMIFGGTECPSNQDEWIHAWDEAGILYRPVSESELVRSLPDALCDKLTWSYRLPDRVFRPHVLLEALARTARDSGVEIRTNTFVSDLLIDERRVYGVLVGSSEEVRSQLVVVAIGAASGRVFSPLFGNIPGRQDDCELVYVKTHQLAVAPCAEIAPFHLVGRGSFNHLPHEGRSVFSCNRYLVVKDPGDHSILDEEISLIEQRVRTVMPRAFDHVEDRKEWVGMTVLAMHFDEIALAQAFHPTIVDHAMQPGGIQNVISIFPGRDTFWADLAANVSVIVHDKLRRSQNKVAIPPWAER